MIGDRELRQIWPRVLDENHPEHERACEQAAKIFQLQAHSIIGAL